MRRITVFSLFLLIALTTYQPLTAQTNYFVDGYHGGIYGHYPLWVTKFIADSLNMHKDWKVNLEIEPESWDTIQLKDPAGYAAIKKLIDDSSDNVAIEYVNPSYGQSYLYNISEESIIRQFQYGMHKLQQHFPAIKFTTYSSEEPCFTSALPGILKSLGFKYASLKNPNTCWGGYVKAYGGESLNWIGPDGTGILTVPRYTSEDLQRRSTWQTTAWNNSEAYINAAFKQGIQYPVGMCLQDAGWKNGRWLGNHKSALTQYTTWRNYFGLIENKKNIENWRLSQEDIQVSLVWGAQVLQRIAQEVRAVENKITMAEKAAALATLYAGVPYPEKEFDEAWRTLLLAQHHDCWIVPYNMHNGKTWAAHVKDWTNFTGSTANNIIQQSLQALTAGASNNDGQNVIAFNTTAINRHEIISVPLDDNSLVTGIEKDGNNVPSQIISNKDSSKTLLFKADVPALSYSSYSFIQATKQEPLTGASIIKNKAGDFVMESDLYKLIIDAQGGNIKQLIAKNLDNKNFVADDANDFNTLRGHFFNNGGYAASTHKPVKITIVENGPLQIKLQVEGTISGNNFIQTITITQGQKRIDAGLHIDYKKGIGIGEDYRQHGGYYSADRHKAFYNDSCKLLAAFPLNLKHQKLYKDAPLDVTESKLSNTFYNRWDSIKNNIVFNWVDVTDGDGNYGMALLSDHVTSYSHGENFPLALTIQYAGIGLWDRNYSISGPTDIHYALIPHRGKWNEAGLNNETIKWNQPVITASANAGKAVNDFIKSVDDGLAVTAMYYKGDDLYIRLVNNSSDEAKHHIRLNCYADELQFVELNDIITSTVQFKEKQKVNFECNIPLFGFKTVKLINARYQ
ncbi:glycoside hydrolase family 38 C-terminal domain-containing protein [Parafilimonas terrae]|uniref:glycoside hydrolase family 38 C-terminal domain-containing protein n=1 Tax=Parafilimonas terrae TaxID=1465490 RepID=UPI001C4335DF|nr:glycoside hydrolase family 38 C-terminal domain-containing protein [Parafilimonas terrae]